jgi:hypothetical protein
MTPDQDPQSDSARFARMRRECGPVHPDVVAARRADVEREQAQREDAETAAIRLRNAWELLDPMRPEEQAEARRTALGNCQAALQTAIGHLHAVLNKPRTHDEQLAADTLARDWLASIGSEPN